MTEETAQSIFKSQMDVFRKYFPLANTELILHDKLNTTGCKKFRDVAWAINNSWNELESGLYHAETEVGEIDFELKEPEPPKLTVNVCKRVLGYSDSIFIGLIRHEIGHLCDPFIESENREQRADDIAHLVFGTRISYSGPHLLQTIGNGAYPRPIELHK